MACRDGAGDDGRERAAVARLGIVAGQPQRRDDGAHDRGTALPVVHLGQSGFAGRDMALDLVESRAFPKGITIQVYQPAGRPQYATD